MSCEDDSTVAIDEECTRDRGDPVGLCDDPVPISFSKQDTEVMLANIGQVGLVDTALEDL